MYDLAMEPPELEGIVSFPLSTTPIGALRFGGRLSKTAGTGFASFRKYDIYALVVVLEGGSGRYRDVRGVDRRVGPGDLIVVFPGLPHQYGPEQGDVWEEIFVAFSGAAFDNWRTTGLETSQPVWNLGDPGIWEGRFSELLQLPVTNLTEACAAAARVHALVSEVLAQRSSPPGNHSWLESACNALGTGAGAPTLQQVARNAGLGYETFRKTFRSAMGESPARYRRRMRLAQAAVMVQQTDLSLELIARSLDFYDAFHFSKAFKLHYGHAPRSRAADASHTERDASLKS